MIPFLFVAAYVVSFVLTLFLMRILLYGIWGFHRRFDAFDWFVCAFWSFMPILSHLILFIMGRQHLVGGWKAMRRGVGTSNDHYRW